MNENITESSPAAQSFVPTPNGVQDLTGKVFGKWTVISYSHRQEKKKTRGARHCWRCRCSCDQHTIKPIAEIYLLNGESKSCGCWRGEFAVKHGMSWGENKHRLYSTWMSMRARCCHSKNANYKRYGARGIKLDDAWMDFSVFVKDMFPSWKEGMTLDRINNNGPYSKENCRWATKSEQMNNMRGNRMVKHQGIEISAKKLQEMCPFLISPGTVYSRLDRGWTTEKIISTPVDYSMSNSCAIHQLDHPQLTPVHYFQPD